MWLTLVFLFNGLVLAAADPRDIQLMATRIQARHTEDDIVAHVFRVLGDRAKRQDAPIGRVEGHVILSFEGPNLAKLDQDFIERSLRRVLEEGETFGGVRYYIARGTWVGVSLLTSDQFIVRLAAARDDEGYTSEGAIQSLCEIVLRAPSLQ